MKVIHETKATTSCRQQFTLLIMALIMEQLWRMIMEEHICLAWKDQIRWRMIAYSNKGGAAVIWNRLHHRWRYSRDDSFLGITFHAAFGTSSQLMTVAAGWTSFSSAVAVVILSAGSINQRSTSITEFFDYICQDSRKLAEDIYEVNVAGHVSGNSLH